MRLAASPWPRTGGDAANSSSTLGQRSGLHGPQRPVLLHRARLPHGTIAARRFERSDVVVAADGTLRVTHRGVLTALGASGARLWTWTERTGLSPPTALSDGATLVLSRGAAIVDAGGALRAQLALEHCVVANGSPCVHPDGFAVFTLAGGGLVLWDGLGASRAVALRGYDVMPPAVAPDGTLVLSAYYGAGLCGVAPDGTLRWQSTLREADLLPSVHPVTGDAAGGALNASGSLLVDAHGARLGSWPQAAVFAAYPDGGWLAQGKAELARLGRTGEPLWRRAMARRGSFDAIQPLVDASGRIFVRTDDALVVLDPGDGSVASELALTGPAESLALVADGVLATVVGDEVVWLGERGG